MELYIQIVDGQPINHPIVEDNFKQAFPNIDTSNLPPEFARFVRIARPTIGDFEIYEGAKEIEKMIIGRTIIGK